MTSPKLPRLVNDPRGPEKVLPTLTTHELSGLIDALYRNLGTSSPDLGAATWYELAVEKDLRRSSSTEDAPRSLTWAYFRYAMAAVQEIPLKSGRTRTRP